MKKLLSVLVSLAMLMGTSVTAYADPEPEIPVEPGIIEEYQYTASANSSLSISNNTATCKSVIRGFSSLATKIEITQTLQETFGGISWYYVASWNNTFYDWYAMYTNTKNPISSGNYRVKTVAKVYSGSDYETITFYSTTITC